jgi:heterodisulfide reductase subunit C
MVVVMMVEMMVVVTMVVGMMMMEGVMMMIDIRGLLRGELSKHQARAEGCVVPDRARCVQCGICSFSCPIGIDVRRYAWRGKSIGESYCLTCGECVARCPRGVLRFERSNLFEPSLNECGGGVASADM